MVNTADDQTAYSLQLPIGMTTMPCVPVARKDSVVNVAIAANHRCDLYLARACRLRRAIIPTYVFATQTQYVCLACMSLRYADTINNSSREK